MVKSALTEGAYFMAVRKQWKETRKGGRARYNKITAPFPQPGPILCGLGSSHLFYLLYRWISQRSHQLATKMQAHEPMREISASIWYVICFSVGPIFLERPSNAGSYWVSQSENSASLINNTGHGVRLANLAGSKGIQDWGRHSIIDRHSCPSICWFCDLA